MTQFDLSKVYGKKISLKTGVIFTKVAKKIKIRQFKREIMALINQIRNNKENYSDEEIKQLKKIEAIKDITEKEEKLKEFNNAQINKAGMDIGLDIALYIVEMIGDAESEVVDLIASYTKQPKDSIIEADIEDIIEVFKIMWENGLYKVFSTFMNKSEDPNNDEEDVLKKTI